MSKIDKNIGRPKYIILATELLSVDLAVFCRQAEIGPMHDASEKFELAENRCKIKCTFDTFKGNLDGMGFVRITSGTCTP